MDQEDNVLLVHFHWEGLDVPGGFWACPGGGIDPGESAEEALRRELAEELGLEPANFEGPAWRLTRLFPMKDCDGQTDLTYLLRTAHFEPRPRVDLLAENVRGLRWFSRAEVTAGIVPFSPRDLADQLAIISREGVPDSPRDIATLE